MAGERRPDITLSAVIFLSGFIVGALATVAGFKSSIDVLSNRVGAIEQRLPPSPLSSAK